MRWMVLITFKAQTRQRSFPCKMMSCPPRRFVRTLFWHRLAVPACKSGMRVVKATPIALTSDLVDVSYVCDECGRETKRTIKGI